MAVTFPPNPNVGDTVTDPATGAVWQWNGTAWVAQGMGAGGFLPLAGGTMTGPLAMNGAAATVTLSGNAAQPLQAVPLQQVEGFVGNNTGRNFIHNPKFSVVQRGIGPFTTGSGFSADRWYFPASGSTFSISIVPLTDADRTAIGDEAAESAWQNVFAGVANSTDGVALIQRIEDARRLSGKASMLSFWAKAISGTPRIGIGISQAFGTGGSPSPVAMAGITATAPLSATWTRYTIPIVWASTAGKTFGTNGDSNSQITLALTDFSNGWLTGIGQQSGTVQIWGVQLEVGSVATLFEHRDPAVDFDLCSRYYQVYTQLTYTGYQTGGSTYYGGFIWATAMRTTPTVVVSGQNYNNSSGGALNSANFNSFSLIAFITATGFGWTTATVAASADI